MFPRSPAAVEMSFGNSCYVPWRRSLVSVEWPLYHGLLCMDTENKVIICQFIFIFIYIFQHCLFLTLWALSSSASVIIVIVIIIMMWHHHHHHHHHHNRHHHNHYHHLYLQWSELAVRRSKLHPNTKMPHAGLEIRIYYCLKKCPNPQHKPQW